MKRSKRKAWNEPPSVHKRSLTMIPGANGERVALSVCRGNGWTMTEDWAAVTCKRCLRRKPPAERAP